MSSDNYADVHAKWSVYFKKLVQRRTLDELRNNVKKSMEIK
jgi:hypothetical protein